MVALLAILLLAAPPTVIDEVPQFTGTMTADLDLAGNELQDDTDGDVTITSGDTLSLGSHGFLADTYELRFGNTLAAPDAWIDNSGTAMCWTSTSVDGGGTDGDLICYTLAGNALDLDTTSLRWDGALLALSKSGLVYSTETSDAAPQALYVHAQPAYGAATGGSQTGANLSLIPGFGSRSITCTDRSLSAADTFTFYTPTGQTITADTDFVCSGAASEEACCDNLGTYINASVTNVSADCDTIAATCVLWTTDTVSDWTLTYSAGGTVAFTIVTGTDGLLTIPGGALDSRGGIWFADDTDTGIRSGGANQIRFYAGGSSKLLLSASVLTAGVNINLNNNLLYDGADQLDLGAACTDSWSTGTGAVCSGGAHTFNGNIYTTAGAIESNANTYLFTSDVSGTAASKLVSIYSGDQSNAGAYSSGGVTISTGATTTAGTTGDITIQTGAAGAGVADAGDVLLKVGGVGTMVAVDGDVGTEFWNYNNAKAAKSTMKFYTESVTFSGGGGDASQTTSGTALPDGAWVLGVSYRVTTAGTTCAGFDIGPAGGDDDLYGSDIAVAQGTTGDNTNATATWNNPILANTEITVTGTNGAGVPANCVSMVVRITVHYLNISADTAN